MWRISRSGVSSGSLSRSCASYTMLGSHRCVPRGSTHVSKTYPTVTTTRKLSGVANHEKFDLVREQSLPEYEAVGRLYRHKGTSGEILSIQTPPGQEENKVFGIGFKTVPKSSNGVAHILEHSVLCGSRKYPVKDPFLHLMRSSLQTFLNAMTYPDKTVYPVSSPNVTDFYNLVDVYLDSVLHPRLSPLVLAQEGWHYERTQQDLQYNGVVFNEMKGVYSSPDFLTSFNLQRNLFPDNNYSLSSGGDPSVIPTLTFEEFKKFHEEHYTPSNGKAFFFGDDPENERLEKIDEFYSEFSESRRPPSIRVQKKFDSPKKVKGRYPVAQGDEENDHYVVVGWVLDHPGEKADGTYHFELDGADKLGLMILSHLLMGTETAVLYKKLADSGLGSAVFGSGFDDNLLQHTFDAGLKGVSPNNVDKVESLVVDTLKNVRKDGFDDDHVAATLNTIEFSLREFAGSSSNKGLSLYIGSLAKWIHGQDPMDEISYEQDLATVKERLESRTYLTSLLDRCLLSNKHRATVDMEPDTKLSEEQEEREKERLNNVASTLSVEAKEEIDTLCKDLTKWQTCSDPPENVAKLPRLSLENIDRNAKEYHCRVEPLSLPQHEAVNTPTSFSTSEHNHKPLLSSYDYQKYHGELAAPLYVSEQATNGIVYTGIHFDAQWVPGSLMYVLPLISLTSFGTSRLDEVQLSHELGKYTGGVSSGVSTSTVPGSLRDINCQFSVSGKATAENASTLVDLMTECILDADFSRKDLIKTRLREALSDMQTDIISSAHSYMGGYLSSLFTPDGALNRRMTGIDHLRFLQKLTKALDSDDPQVVGETWNNLYDAMTSLRELIVQQNNVMLTLKADQRSMDKIKPQLENFPSELGTLDKGVVDRATNAGEALLRSINVSETFPDCWPKPLSWSEKLSNEKHGLSFEIPSQVNYAGKALPLYDPGEGSLGHPLAKGPDEVVSQLLAKTFLWENIRMQGGAYGAFASLNPLNGMMTFMSFRDPEISKSIEVFDATADFVAQLSEEISDEDLENAVISTIGSIDSPLSPQGKGAVAIRRKMLGITQESVQQRRDEILSTTRTDFSNFSERLRHLSENGIVAVAGSGRALSADEICRSLPSDKL